MADVKLSPRKTLTIRVSEQLHRDARLISVRRGENLNGLVTKWLQSWVEHHREETR